LSGPWIFV